MRWISVKNQMPEEGSVVDIWVKLSTADGYRVTDVLYHGAGYQDDIGVSYNKEEVTHWRYPPAPPLRN